MYGYLRMYVDFYWFFEDNKKYLSTYNTTVSRVYLLLSSEGFPSMGVFSRLD